MIPDHVMIDGSLYFIQAADLETEDGEYCAASQTIRVQRYAPAPYKRVILLHELIHACYEHAGSPAEPLAEEAVALLISRRLLPILRDNPELVEYLTAK